MESPRLLKSHTLTEISRLHPESMQITLNSDSWSTASMQLPSTDPEVIVDNWIRIICPNGESFVSYVKSVDTNYVTNTRSVSVEHVGALLSDSVVFGKLTYSGKTDIAEVIDDLLSYQSTKVWTAGTCAYTAAEPWEFNNDDVWSDLESLTDCVEDSMWAYDFSSMPFKLSLKKVPTTASCEMRMSRNITGLTVNVSRSGMYTRVYPVGAKNKGISSVNSGKAYLDRNTSTYGIIEKVITDQSIKNASALLAYGKAQLKKYAEPSVSVSCTGLLLSELTGEPMDKLLLNTVCRVPLPDYGTTVNNRIITMQWQDAIKQPQVVSITMANERETLSHIVKSSKSGSKKSATANGCGLQDDEDWQNKVDVKVGEVDGGWQAIVSGVNEYNENCESYIKITDEAITSKVGKGQVISSINQTAEKITISASKIDLDGYVTASQLDTTNAKISNMMNGTTTCSLLSAQSIKLAGYSLFLANGYVRYGTGD